MMEEILVPELGESVLEATVIRWLKKEGDPVQAGDPVAELETDKVNLEVGSEWSGMLTEIRTNEGEDVQVGDVLAVVDPEAEIPSTREQPRQPEKTVGREEEPAEDQERSPASAESGQEMEREMEVRATPVAREMASEAGLDLSAVQGSGAGGRITKADVEGHLEAAEQEADAPRASEPKEERAEERVRMSRRRRTIARRMVEAQSAAAMLTTFNEINMGAVMDLRRRRNPGFQERHGVKLGIVSFFIKACVAALKEYPRLNAEIDGEEMVLKHYYDIGVAIGDEKGLVVPVVRNVDQMTFAQIEAEINGLVEKTREGELDIEDLRGGTFTITNGGVFGSLLSTPILNPPQVAILGLHKIEDRPIALEEEIVIQPMMYVALSYDHRIVDGREAVQFLVRIKEYIEDPGLLLVEA